MGTCHQFYSARSCELALHAVGAARGRPGGGTSCLGVGRPGSGALPPPTARRLGRAAGPTDHWLLMRAVWAWKPVTYPTARALVSWLCALWGRHEGARGGRLLPGCGASAVARSPTAHCPSFGACCRGPLPTGCWCGGRGRGDPSPTQEGALLRPGFARCEGGTRAPLGAPLACVWDVRGRALCQPRPLVLWGVLPGLTTHWLWVRGCGRGDPSPTPQHALSRAGFALSGGGRSIPWAGLLLPLGFTRIGEEERRDGEAIALHKTHIWANSLKPVCFLCFLLFWCPLLPFIETGTLKIYTKMVLYMKNEIFDLKYPLHGLSPRKLHPVFHLKGGICLQKKMRSFRVFPPQN